MILFFIRNTEFKYKETTSFSFPFLSVCRRGYRKKMNPLKISRFPDFIQYFPDFSQRFPDFSLKVNFSRFTSANVVVV